ncbi:MAG: (Fe-S)-binding protein [Thermoplasmata archaeon]|nr:(Fe-S)-binding protein [Thermoplasmata archaeon]
MLEDYHDEILSCTGCGFCKKSYYAYNFVQKESDYPKGKIMIAYGLLTGELNEDENVVKSLQKCSLCKRCEEDCPSLIKIADVIKAARYSLKMLLPPHQNLLKNFNEKNNIFGDENFEKDGGKIAFFMGCLTNREMKDVVISLFDKLGLNVSIVGGCCGYPIHKIGRETNEKMKEGLREKNFDRIVMACPNGMIALREFNPIHISQFILSLGIKESKKDKNYIYHDSAFLGRYFGIYEEPRQVIKKFGNLVEFSENRSKARQCGGEIEFKLAFPDEAGEMAEYLAREAKKTGATIVTASPHCYSHLKEFADVIDIVQLIEENIA